jgi:hypothetical protein
MRRKDVIARVLAPPLTDIHHTIEKVFRIEQARLIAGLARMVRDWASPKSWRRALS